MRTILDVILFTAGFGACWFCKDPVLRLVNASHALIKRLGTKLTVLRGRS